MKIIDYILKIAFALGVTLGATFLAGPAIIKSSFEDKDKLKNVTIETISLDFLAPGNTNYMTLEIILSDKHYKKVYYLQEGKHKDLINFLTEKELIRKSDIREQLPVHLSGQQLSQFSAAFRADNNILERLSIDGTDIVGNEPGIVKKILAVAVGSFIILLGIVLFVIQAIAFFNNFKIYRETGTLPELPNTIDEMKKGLKFLLGIK